MSSKCIECNSSIISDIHNGESICSNCGIVTERMVYAGSDAKSADMDGGISSIRASGVLSYTKHDLGVSTVIDSSKRDFSGKPINSEFAQRFNFVQKLDNRAKIATSKDKRLTAVLSKIDKSCTLLGLPKNVSETASLIYRKLDELQVKNKVVICISTTVIYMACKQCNIVYGMSDICKTMCTNNELKRLTNLSSRYHREIMLQSSVPMTAPMTMKMYISKLVNYTKANTRVARLAMEIAEKTENSRVVDGKDPNGVAAAYLYIASNLFGQHLLQRSVSDVAKITETTIRTRCKEILDNNKVKIILRPVLA